jgi:methyl-accepting chemotaxis protein
MEASRQIVGSVVSVAETAAASMTDIETATGNAREAIAGISYALREQRSTSTDLARNVESIAQMSEENSIAATSVADTAKELVTVASTLKSAVSHFNT